MSEIAFVAAWQHVDDGTLEALTRDGRIFQWNGQEWTMIPGSESAGAPKARGTYGERSWANMAPSDRIAPVVERYRGCVQDLVTDILDAAHWRADDCGTPDDVAEMMRDCLRDR